MHDAFYQIMFTPPKTNSSAVATDAIINPPMSFIMV